MTLFDLTYHHAGTDTVRGYKVRDCFKRGKPCIEFLKLEPEGATEAERTRFYMKADVVSEILVRVHTRKGA